MRIRARALLFCGVMLWAAMPAAADVVTYIGFKGSGQETPATASQPQAAVNTFGQYDEYSETQTPSSHATDDYTWNWSSETASVSAQTKVAVDNMNLKSMARLGGGAASTVQMHTCVFDPVTCPTPMTFTGANWNEFSFTAIADATAIQRVSIVAPSATPSSFRLVFDVEGLTRKYIDWIVTAPVSGGTGGGYMVPMFLIETALMLNYGEWGHDWYEDLYRFRSDDGSTESMDLNMKIADQSTPHNESVVSPSLKVGSTGSWPINLWLSTMVRVDLLNLDDGHVVFIASSDYSNTVTLKGFEVFDENGRLLPDAVVTGEDGTVYKTLGGQVAPVPEPTTLLLVGTGLVGAARRWRAKA